MRTREFGHNQSTAALVADETPENSIGDARHGGQHGGRRDVDVADLEFARKGHSLTILTVRSGNVNAIGNV